MTDPVEKRQRLWTGAGMAVYATDRSDRQVVEFEDEIACEVSFRVHERLARHALPTSFEARLTGRSLLVQKTALLPVEVKAEAAPGQVRLTFLDGGRAIAREEAEAALTPERLERIEDAAQQAARALRAHLSLRGVDRLRLHLRFGVTDEGACLMQVINPLECRLGTEDLREAAALLGGD